MHGGNEECKTLQSWNMKGGTSWETQDSMEMDLLIIACQSVEWIKLIQNEVSW